MLFDATEAAAWAGDHARMSEVTRRAALVPGANDDAHAFLANLLVATGGLMEGRPPSDLPSIDDLILRSERFDEPRWLVWAAVAAGAVGNADGEAALLRRAGSLARSSGAIDTLVLVVQVKAGLALLEGRFDVQAEVTEGLRLAREANLTNVVALHLAVLAWFAAASGDGERGPGYAAEASELARTNGAGFANAIAEWALAHRDLTDGRADDVASRLSDLRSAPTGLMHPQIVLLSTPDLVEALIRAGHADEARAANELLAASAVPGVAAWLRALAARTRALLAEDDVDAESSFEEALELHGEWPRPFDRARTELLCGEHLRRRRRRTEARTHLRSALQALEALGAEPWAERARLELRASGETAHRRDPAALTELTPQELQIARLVAEGASNKEVAVQLFLSPRTVEYHLRKVFLKLGITSRSQLHRQALGAAA
jgi:DNA-binding CsgD family transcriptional regulator